MYCSQDLRGTNYHIIISSDGPETATKGSGVRRPLFKLKYGCFRDDMSNHSLLIIIVPYRHSIGKCFVFFPYALEYKIYSQKLYHIKYLHIKSKASAYMSRHLHIQALVLDFIRKCGWKKNKAFAYRVPIGDYNYLQCTYTKKMYSEENTTKNCKNDT